MAHACGAEGTWQARFCSLPAQRGSSLWLWWVTLPDQRIQRLEELVSFLEHAHEEAGEEVASLRTRLVQAERRIVELESLLRGIVAPIETPDDDLPPTG